MIPIRVISGRYETWTLGMSAFVVNFTCLHAIMITKSSHPCHLPFCIALIPMFCSGRIWSDTDTRIYISETRSNSCRIVWCSSGGRQQAAREWSRVQALSGGQTWPAGRRGTGCGHKEGPRWEGGEKTEEAAGPQPGPSERTRPFKDFTIFLTAIAERRAVSFRLSLTE